MYTVDLELQSVSFIERFFFYCVLYSIFKVSLSEVLLWNLRIKHTLGLGVLSFIERFPLFGG